MADEEEGDSCSEYADKSGKSDKSGLVLSEIHFGMTRSGLGTTQTTWSFPLNERYDSDGDLVLDRKRKNKRYYYDDEDENESMEVGGGKITLRVNHENATVLERVGLQVWAGGLALCDWLASKREGSSPRGEVVLDLGCGTGLQGIAAAALGCDAALLTDASEEALALAEQNAEANGVQRACFFRLLDWTRPLRPQLEPEQSSSGRFLWTPQDALALSRATLILAGDCAYEDGLTAHLVRTLKELLSQFCHPQAVALVAAEKRWNFERRGPGFEVGASAYDQLVRCLAGAVGLEVEEEEAPVSGADVVLLRVRWRGEQSERTCDRT